MLHPKTTQALLLLALLGPFRALASAGDCRYQERDGLVVIELESASPGGDWVLESAVPGYTGAGYLRWNGANHFNTPGYGTFGFDFEVHQAGYHWLGLHNHHDDPDVTAENDVWVRMDGGEWIKVFSDENDGWTWSTFFEIGSQKPPAGYDLSAGVHRIELSGRSYDFRIDRLHLYVSGQAEGNSTAAPESECEAENGPPVAVIRITPEAIPEDDAHQTVITLDSRGSFDPNDDPLQVRWSVRGARFVDGTGPGSPVARITLPGGHGWPIQLGVQDDGSPALSDRATSVLSVAGSGSSLAGEPVVWHPLEVCFRGPYLQEGQVAPNPFLDYRLTVTFRGPSGSEWSVPGFFDGNGEGGGTGDVWKARFSADEAGVWEYRASFRSGDAIAVELDPDAGAPDEFDGTAGSVLVLGRDKQAPGFLSKGRLGYVGEHYLKFQNGPYFLKGGADSPENFLGYRGFDGVFDAGGIGNLHEYGPHVGDWRPGDPYFVSAENGIDSKGIVGALNYLGQQGVNSLYFLPMNLGGDGQDTWPFVSHENTSYAKTHYDISRLAQWKRVFEHAQRNGILLHFVLGETETANEGWLDGSQLGVERKLFYRELVARFGHLLGIKWNLCEENDFPIERLRSFAAYLDAQDAYDHPIAVHTHPNDFDDYQALAGDPLFGATSIQYDPDLAGSHVETWRAASAAAGHKWVLDMDENNPAQEGLTDTNAVDLRKRVLYDVYFSGGEIEWYFGYHELPLGGDLQCEDFRTREAMWTAMRHARELLEGLPFWQMGPADALLAGEAQDYGGGEVFAKAGEVYAVYLPKATPAGNLDLSGASGSFQARWWNPRSGTFEGEASTVQGGAPRPLGSPPSSASEDWVWLLERTQ